MIKLVKLAFLSTINQTFFGSKPRARSQRSHDKIFVVISNPGSGLLDDFHFRWLKV